MKYLLR